MKIDEICCEWQIENYWHNGSKKQLDGKVARISGDKYYPDGWYFLVGVSLETPAKFCLNCGKKCE